MHEHKKIFSKRLYLKKKIKQLNEKKNWTVIDSIISYLYMVVARVCIYILDKKRAGLYAKEKRKCNSTITEKIAASYSCL